MLALRLWIASVSTGPASWRRCEINFSIPTVPTRYKPWDREFWTPAICQNWTEQRFECLRTRRAIMPPTKVPKQHAKKRDHTGTMAILSANCADWVLPGTRPCFAAVDIVDVDTPLGWKQDESWKCLGKSGRVRLVLQLLRCIPTSPWFTSKAARHSPIEAPDKGKGPKKEHVSWYLHIFYIFHVSKYISSYKN